MASQRYGRALDRAVEAERLAAGAVWLSEHHSFEDGYLPQPMTFAAAVATRTSRVRIGTAVMLAPLRPPLDLAEQSRSSTSSPTTASRWASARLPDPGVRGLRP